MKTLTRREALKRGGKTLAVAGAVATVGAALAALDVRAPKRIRQAVAPDFVYVYNWNKDKWIEVKLTKQFVAGLEACDRDPEKQFAYLQVASGGAS